MITNQECDPIIVAESVLLDKPTERFDAEILNDKHDRDHRLDEFEGVE